MESIVIAAIGDVDPKGYVGVVVDGEPVPDIPGLYITGPLDPVEGQGEVVVTHAPTGLQVKRYETRKIAARHCARLHAVSVLHGIDWTKTRPIAKRERRKMAAVRWALDPVAAMFRASLPFAVPDCMEARPPLPDHLVRILLG